MFCLELMKTLSSSLTSFPHNSLFNSSTYNFFILLTYSQVVPNSFKNLSPHVTNPIFRSSTPVSATFNTKSFIKSLKSFWLELQTFTRSESIL